jgi:hypothetical protein
MSALFPCYFSNNPLIYNHNNERLLMKCRCGREVEAKRIEILGSDKCSECAKRQCNGRNKGIMVWNHKTAPEIQVVSKETHEQYKKDTYRKGNGSILRNKSPKQGAAL